MSAAPAARAGDASLAQGAPAPATPFERALWLLALLPAAAMALPSAVWRGWPAWLGPAAHGDPLPLASAAGRTLLLALPLLLLLIGAELRAALGRGPSAGERTEKGAQRGPLALLLLLLLARASELLGRPLDHDGAAALLPPALALLGGLAGLCLSPRGAPGLARGLCVLSLLCSAGALGTALFDAPLGLAGVLGNSGPSTQLALPGALAGLWLWTRGSGAGRRLGAAAFLATALHAALAPALAALLALALGALTLAATGRASGAAASLDPQAPAGNPAGPGSNPRRLARLGLAAAAALGIGGLAWLAASLPARGAAPAPGPLSGLEVRLWLWSTVPELLDRDWGAPKPAFEDAYETLRPPAERALSAAASGGPTAVEHLHQDWFQLAFDFGPFAAGLGLLLALAAAAGALRALRIGSTSEAALGAALLGLLLLSMQHTPLTRTAPTAWLAGLAAGLLAPRRPTRARPADSQRGQALLAALGLGAGALTLSAPALGLCLQGQRLAQALLGDGAPLTAERLLPPPAWQRYSAPLALGLAARAETDPQRRAAYVEAWLDKRAHTPEALIQAGLEAVEGDPQRAAALWTRALEIDPEQAIARQNLLRLYLTAKGRIPAIERCNRLGPLFSRLTPEQRRPWLLEAQRFGWLPPLRIAEALLGIGQRLGPNPQELDLDMSLSTGPIPAGLPESIDALAQAAPEDSDERATLESLAQQLWAQQNASLGMWDDALRSYRQALRQSRWAGRPGSWLIRAELAHAARQAGRDAEAQASAPPTEEVEADLLPLLYRAQLPIEAR
jgi:tetratricopeptide (TPR) repeat protein